MAKQKLVRLKHSEIQLILAALGSEDTSLARELKQAMTTKPGILEKTEAGRIAANQSCIGAGMFELSKQSPSGQSKKDAPKSNNDRFRGPIEWRMENY